MTKTTSTSSTTPKSDECSSVKYTLSIKTGIDCIFHIDGEAKMQLLEGVMTEISLPPGKYTLLFVGMDSPELRQEVKFEMPAQNTNYTVVLSPRDTVSSHNIKSDYRFADVGIKTNLENTIRTLKTVIKRSPLSQEVQESLINQLLNIKKRIKDDTIYFGIVGELSSGKSTFINSLIGENFFRTGPSQETTRTITKLEYGSRINLEIKLTSKKTLKYNKDKTTILRQFCPEKLDEFSGFQKIKMCVLDLLHLNKADDFLLDVFDKITTSEEMSHTLENVIIYHPSKILKDGIAIIDTPGTDAANPSYAEITLRTIQDECDIAFVLTTASQILSPSLVQYLSENLEKVAEKCIYTITKTELIRESKERSHIQHAVSQKAQNLFTVKNPKVILAPSLLSLEERGIVEKTGLMDQMSYEERRTLCHNYKSDIGQIVEKIQNEKESNIKDTVQRLIRSLRNNVRSEIETKEIELKKELEETRMMRVKPLREFMDDFYASHPVLQLSSSEKKIMDIIASHRSEFKNYVFNIIDNSSTKDEVQSTMNDPATALAGDAIFSKCYDDFIEVLTDIKTSYVDNFEEFKTSFYNMFSIKSVDFEYTIINNPSWQKKYDFHYNKRGLTTFLLIRLFKSLDSIKEEMKNDVGPKIDIAFGRMEKHYVECVRKSHLDIEKQMEKVKRFFIKEYENVIAKRIEESDKHEQTINSKLDLLKSNLATIKNLRFSNHISTTNAPYPSRS